MSKPLARTAKGKRPRYFHDPATDRLLAIVLSLTEELSVTRERLDALERVLDASGALRRTDLDAFVPDAAGAAERAAAREAFIARVMRAVEMELSELERGETGDFEQVYRTLL